MLVGVVFDNLDGTNLQYTIRPVHEVDGEFDDSTWDTDIAQPRFQEPGPRFSPKYVIIQSTTVYMVYATNCVYQQLAIAYSLIEWTSSL